MAFGKPEQAGEETQPSPVEAAEAALQAQEAMLAPVEERLAEQELKLAEAKGGIGVHRVVEEMSFQRSHLAGIRRGIVEKRLKVAEVAGNEAEKTALTAELATATKAAEEASSEHASVKSSGPRMLGNPTLD